MEISEYLEFVFSIFISWSLCSLELRNLDIYIFFFVWEFNMWVLTLAQLYEDVLVTKKFVYDFFYPYCISD